CNDDAASGVLRRFKLYFQVLHRIVFVPETTRLAKPDPIDDGGMVQLIRDDSVLFSEQRFENSAVGIESRGIEDGIFHTEEGRQFPFELAMNILRSANEAYAAHAVSPDIDGLFGRLRDFGMRRQTEIIVGAEIQHFFAAHRYFRPLGAGNDAFGLEKSGSFYLFQLGGDTFHEGGVHSMVSFFERSKVSS